MCFSKALPKKEQTSKLIRFLKKKSIMLPSIKFIYSSKRFDRQLMR